MHELRLHILGVAKERRLRIVSEKRHKCRILHPNVLTVAVEDDSGGWGAYIGITPGENPKIRWRRVYGGRVKLLQKVAEVLFPDFKHLEWRPE